MDPGRLAGRAERAARVRSASYGRLVDRGGGHRRLAACARVGAFDSLLQRDGADAARGPRFARFETRFQLLWVLGGVLAVIFPSDGRWGIFLVALVLLFAGLSYVGACAARPRGDGPAPRNPASGNAGAAADRSE